MIIGIDASRINKQERTGVEWYSYFLIQEFKKLVPPDIRVILYMQSAPAEDILPLPSNWEIKILRWPFRFWTILRLSWEMLLHKPDIFFSPANILPFFTPQKTFTTIHDIGFKRFPDCYSATERLLQDWGAKCALKKSNTPLRSSSFAGQAIFVPSEFTKKELVEVYGADAEKITVTPLGADTKSLTAVNNSVNSIFEKFNIKKPYFLFLGRKEEKKNINAIIEAFKIFHQNHPDYSLVLGGPNPSKKDGIPASAGMTPVEWINTQEKQILLSNAEALIFPSLYEGFGLPILEAFAMGAPVITSNTCSMPEVAGDAAILVNPKNTNDIAQAMEKITKNPELRDELIKKGTERVKNFSWELCAKITINKILPNRP